MDSTILSFANQTDGAQGLLVTAQHGFTMHDLAVEDTKGDGIKILGTTKVRISKHARRVDRRCERDERLVRPLSGAVHRRADRRQRRQGRVGLRRLRRPERHDRACANNHVELNVAGIEIENSTNADVHDNTATNNTGGILVFNLPGLEVENGADHARVRQPGVREQHARTSRPTATSSASCRPAPASRARRAPGRDLRQQHPRSRVGQHRRHQLRADGHPDHRRDVRPVSDGDLHPRQHARGHERHRRPARSARC